MIHSAQKNMKTWSQALNDEGAGEHEEDSAGLERVLAQGAVVCLNFMDFQTTINHMLFKWYVPNDCKNNLQNHLAWRLIFLALHTFTF